MTAIEFHGSNEPVLRCPIQFGIKQLHIRVFHETYASTNSWKGNQLLISM